MFSQVTHRLQPFKESKPLMQGAKTAGLYRMLGAEYANIHSFTIDSDCEIEHTEELSRQIETEFLQPRAKSVSESSLQAESPLCAVSEAGYECFGGA